MENFHVQPLWAGQTSSSFTEEQHEIKRRSRLPKVCVYQELDLGWMDRGHRQGRRDWGRVGILGEEWMSCANVESGDRWHVEETVRCPADWVQERLYIHDYSTLYIGNGNRKKCSQFSLITQGVNLARELLASWFEHSTVNQQAEGWQNFSRRGIPRLSY